MNEFGGFTWNKNTTKKEKIENYDDFLNIISKMYKDDKLSIINEHKTQLKELK